MSYMSTSENVGGIPQNISETSCASQYKMAVESVPGSCNSNVNMYINDSSGDEQSYIPHLSENFFHSKFKIDPNDLYTFHDSDVIAGEITVSNTEENVTLSDTEGKAIPLESPIKELDLLGGLNNGEIKQTANQPFLNGHCKINEINNAVDKKTVNAKVKKVQAQDICVNQPKITVIHRPGLPSPKGYPPTNKALQHNSDVSKDNAQNVTAKAGGETFLDVFKREQILSDSQVAVNKTEPYIAPVKISTPAQKKSAAKPSTKAKKGRGPIQHEALQRISPHHRVIVQPIKNWHSPDEELFECGPLDIQNTNPYKLLESSSDDDIMPDYESGSGPVCVEESAAESRSARLELRRSAMRRQVSRTATAMHLTKKHDGHRALAALIKRQLNGASSCRLPQQTMNHLLAMRGMTGTLSLQERRTLRASGWSASDSSKLDSNATSMCAEEKCTLTPLPCARYCLSHITMAPEQRLYAACAAVFAGGERCKQPLLPLHEQTPLCPEHAWKRDNYELLSREKPQKSRKRACPMGSAVRPPRPPRKPKRRRRLVAKRPPVHTQSLSEINAYSNSSAYDSEDTGIGGLSESEYIGGTATELEVGQVPPDDILDPSVLSQMPDEAFTEFFNQAEGGTFAESCELAAALEAVLDERALDMTDVFTNSPVPANKMQVAVSMESSSAPS
ncbi:uncharacterized protein LOC125053103 isoform X2 [Pieris napi]|uniref:uncharacterized protein LOC125053103 isoform X2 n=1 Tax=Pieris napi TaxID=78633 RepID=UPI001FBADB1B|nr:uncharacterized protein LOC125053103 isoform X2 [Pieris napi]